MKVLAVIGGLFVISGWTFLVGGFVSISLVGPAVSNLLIGGSVPVIALGAGLLSVAGRQPLRGRGMRIGLGLLALGLAMVRGSSIRAAALAYDPLEDGPTVLLSAAGAIASFIGALVTGLSLLRMPGRPRLVGLLFFGGLALFLGGSTLGNHDTVPDPVLLAIRAVGVLGAAGLALGGTGLGVLAIIGRDAKSGSAVVVA